MRSCVNCGTRIGIRATRCPPCRRAYRTQYENDRAAKVRQAAQEARARDNAVEDEVDQEVVDYCAPGAASRPPSFSGVPAKPKPVRTQEVLGDGRVPHPADRGHRYDLTGLSGSARQNRYNVEREMVRQIRGEDDDSDMMNWNDLQAVNMRFNDNRKVTFPAPSMATPAYDHLGRPFGRARRWG